MAMIIARAALAAAIVAGAAVALPAAAQNAPENGVLVIYGNQKCPTDSSGREIVVCSRRGADEQYRIPKELRELQVTPENESWAARDQAVLDAGASGCFAKQAAAAKREREARKEAQSNIP